MNNVRTFKVSDIVNFNLIVNLFLFLFYSFLISILENGGFVCLKKNHKSIFQRCKEKMIHFLISDQDENTRLQAKRVSANLTHFLTIKSDN